MIRDRDVPKRLRLDLPNQRLEVGWHDGHESVYESAYLRLVCPCAGCRGHAPGEVEPPTWEQVKDVKVVDAAAVGAYAIQLSFSDGHSSGIYSFDRLRAACRCADCARTRDAGASPPPASRDLS